ncbi:MAG: exodeoxyribonuclease III [Alphaproteobacteria bacterium]
MRIATWNINSVRLRLDAVARLAEEARPDVICLQETKCPDDKFPAAAIADMGYPHQVFRGMKSYNGVAILSRLPLDGTGGRDWCGRQDCRHAAAGLPGSIELHNFYVPSGGDVPDPDANDKFAHKLQFLKELAAWWRKRAKPRAKRIMVGDFNVAPLETDVWSHKRLLDVVSHTPIEVAHLGAVQAAHDWRDAVRHFVPESEQLYSWWSYRARDWRASDRGRRLDHIWVTPALKARLAHAEILKDARDWPKASDHVPVIAELKP